MILFYCSAMEDLAKSIARLNLDSRMRLPHLLIKPINLGSIIWGVFQNGDPNIFIESVEHNVEGQDVAFLASWTSKDFFNQLAVIYALPRYRARSMKIILPYFPGTMDRVEVKGQVATAMTLARQLSAVECKEAELTIYDIHALHEFFYFRHPVVVRLESGIQLLKSALFSMPDADNVAVAFPDEGAYKRFGRMFPEYSQVVCYKQRLGDKRKVKIVDGNPRGKHMVIVDDLVMTGGTILECAHALVAKGAAAVSAYVTHAVFPNKSYDDMKFPFANFWITDSYPETIKAMETISPLNKFEVLSLAPPIAKILAE